MNEVLHYRQKHRNKKRQSQVYRLKNKIRIGRLPPMLDLFRKEDYGHIRIIVPGIKPQPFILWERSTILREAMIFMDLSLPLLITEESTNLVLFFPRSKDILTAIPMDQTNKIYFMVEGNQWRYLLFWCKARRAR